MSVVKSGYTKKKILGLFILTDINSVANTFISELRDSKIQTDSMRFRRNMERLGEILAYELSKQMEYKSIDVQTPLGSSNISVIEKDPYLITIMRAGVPFFQGFLNFFDKADCGFIGAYRSDFDDKNKFDIDMGYMAVGDVNHKEIIIIDPMLATGKSILKAVNQLIKIGKPKRIHIVALIAARKGYEYVRNNLKISTDFWIATMDEQLNSKSYIVPGLGDAGDLSFGKKS